MTLPIDSEWPSADQGGAVIARAIHSMQLAGTKMLLPFFTPQRVDGWLLRLRRGYCYLVFIFVNWVRAVAAFGASGFDHYRVAVQTR